MSGVARCSAWTLSKPYSRSPANVVEAEHATEPIADEEGGKAALTELFEEANNEKTLVIAERVVNDIDEIVKYVRFDGWQDTQAGEREVKVLRKTLFNYKSHQDRGIHLIKDLGDC